MVVITLTIKVSYSAYPGIREYPCDKSGAVTEIRYPDGTREQYVYDDHQHCLQKTDRLGRQTQQAYDQKGRLIQETRPEGLVTNRHYDEEGNLTTITDKGGREIRLFYDGCHHLIRRQEKLAEGEYREQRYTLYNYFTTHHFNKSFSYSKT